MRVAGELESYLAFHAVMSGEAFRQAEWRYRDRRFPGFPDDFSHEQSAKLVVIDIDGTVLREEVGLVPSPWRKRGRRLTPEAEIELRETFVQMRNEYPEAYARWLQKGLPADFVDGRKLVTREDREER